MEVGGRRVRLRWRSGGRVRGIVEGADFAAALFSIWLGEVPFDDTLKNGLLDSAS